jgi:serine/threonine-protein kinase
MTASPDDLERLVAEALFLEALDVPSDARDDLILSRAAGNLSLIAAVRSLLAANATGGPLDRLEAAIGVDRAPGGDPAVSDDLIGDVIGPYRLLRRIGQGGMGSVYLAERADGQFEHRVAIKLLRADRTRHDVARRFLNERRILAQLVHPHIALLLDGNVTANGRPYLVMEYVEGAPLTDHCDRRRLGVNERLQLFLDVASAVDYAHRRLVVHRDIKPGNTIVTDDGRVKLLDFGIARLLEDTDGARDLTATGQQVMTPAYASPEQLRGDTVDTASDVYQLGGLLYELLTGDRPFRLPDESAVAFSHVALTTDPEPPSRAVGRRTPDVATARGLSSARLARELEGDLDAIILKALRKEPEQRYRSAGHLADDVERYLHGLPVLARRGTWRYRTARYVRRHRTSVLAGAAVAAAMIVGTISTSLQATRAREQAAIAGQERDRARVEAARADQVSQFLLGMFDVAQDRGVRADTLRLLPVVDAAVSRIGTELHGQPEVRARTQATAALAYIKLGRLDDALRVSTLGVAAARESGSASAVALALDVLGSVHWEKGDLDGTTRSYAEEITVLSAVVLDSIMHIQRAVALRSLAGVHWRRRQLDSALTALDAADADFRAANALGDRAYAAHLDMKGVVLAASGRVDDAVGAQEEALSLRRRLFKEPHLDIAQSLNNLATNLARSDRFDDAVVRLEESLAMRRSLYGAEHPEVAVTLHNIAAVRAAQGRIEESIVRYREAVAMRVRLLGDDHLDVATSRAALGFVLRDAGRPVDAVPLLRAAVPPIVRQLGAASPPGLKLRAYLAISTVDRARYAAAERELLEILPAMEGLLGPDHSESLRVRGFLHDLYVKWERPADAARFRTTPSQPAR